MQFDIQPYHIADLSKLYRIFLLTADSGKDAILLFTDPDLPGHFSAAPYALFEPDLCFVLTNNSEPCGYILGTNNSDKFYQRCEKDWFPPLRIRFPMPEAQGHGIGRKLMDTFINKLRELKITALHLEVGKRNPGAIKFYEKMDFKIIKENEYSISFGKLISY